MKNKKFELDIKNKKEVKVLESFVQVFYNQGYVPTEIVYVDADKSDGEMIMRYHEKKVDYLPSLQHPVIKFWLFITFPIWAFPMAIYELVSEIYEKS